MKKLLNRLMGRFGYMPIPTYTTLLATVRREEEVVRHVRGTLTIARDWYALRGRRILSVDLDNYLGAFEEAQKFDRLDNSPQATSRTVN
jgi:hypothetical protein